MGELDELLREQRVLIAALKATSRRLMNAAHDNGSMKLPAYKSLLLLRMSEALIAAHRTAKVDDDGYTLDLIEDAMRHVGARLARETGDDRQFDRKRLEPF